MPESRADLHLAQGMAQATQGLLQGWQQFLNDEKERDFLREKRDLLLQMAPQFGVKLDPELLKQFGGDANLNKMRAGVGALEMNLTLAQRQQEKQAMLDMRNEALKLQSDRLGETTRHNKAMEGLEQSRIEAQATEDDTPVFPEKRIIDGVPVLATKNRWQVDPSFLEQKEITPDTKLRALTLELQLLGEQAKTALGGGEEETAIKKEMTGLLAEIKKIRTEAPKKAEKPSDERVRVKSPDGKIGNIPKSQLDAALKAGYTEVK